MNSDFKDCDQKISDLQSNSAAAHAASEQAKSIANQQALDINTFAVHQKILEIQSNVRSRTTPELQAILSRSSSPVLVTSQFQPIASPPPSQKLDRYSPRFEQCHSAIEALSQKTNAMFSKVMDRLEKSESNQSLQLAAALLQMQASIHQSNESIKIGFQNFSDANARDKLATSINHERLAEQVQSFAADAQPSIFPNFSNFPAPNPMAHDEFYSANIPAKSKLVDAIMVPAHLPKNLPLFSRQHSFISPANDSPNTPPEEDSLYYTAHSPNPIPDPIIASLVARVTSLENDKSAAPPRSSPSALQPTIPTLLDVDAHSKFYIINKVVKNTQYSTNDHSNNQQEIFYANMNEKNASDAKSNSHRSVNDTFARDISVPSPPRLSYLLVFHIFEAYHILYLNGRITKCSNVYSVKKAFLLLDANNKKLAEFLFNHLSTIVYTIIGRLDPKHWSASLPPTTISEMVSTLGLLIIESDFFFYQRLYWVVIMQRHGKVIAYLT